MTLVFIGLSFALFGVRVLLNRHQRLPYLIVGFYAFPLYLLTALSSPGYAPLDASIESGVANIGRVALHSVAFLLLASSIVMNRGGRLRISVITIPALASCVWMMFVALGGNTAPDTVLRAMLSLLVVVSFFILLPSLVNEPKLFMLHMGRASIMLTLVLIVLSAITIWRFGPYPAWTMRFGRPLNPNVLSYLVLLAFVCSWFTRTPWFVRALLGGVLLATGSRASTGLAVLFCLVLLVQNRRSWKHAVLAAVPMAVLGISLVSYIPDLLSQGEQVLYTRSSLTSGRFEAWTDAASVIKTNPLLGVGERFQAEDVGPSDREMRLHNLYLEMAASYGVPMALLSLIVYGMLWRGVVMSSRRLGIDSVSGRAIGFYALSMAVVPLVSTVSWLNLGDGASVLSLATTLPLVVHSTRRAVRTSAIT